MKAKPEQIANAVNEFIETELMPAGNGLGGMDQFLFGVKMGIAKRKAAGAINDMVANPMAKTVAILDADGNVDVDTVYNAAIDSIRKVGSVEIAGFAFKEGDFNRLYEIVKRHSNGG